MHFPHRTGPPPPTQRVMHKSQRLVRRSLAARLTALHKCTSRVSASAMPQCLSEEQVRLFHEQGYLVLEKYWDASTVARLRTRMQHIVAGYGDIQSNKEASVFTTKEQGRNDNDYFLRSGSDISFFWEEGSRDSTGAFVQSPELSINKIGHALQDLDPVFESVSYTPRITGICKDLGLKKPLSVQSMYIFKQPRIGGEVGAHQDGTFLYTDPQSVLGFWWALDDCSILNGCLWAIPGSHLSTPVSRKFRRKGSSTGGTEFYPSESVPYDLTGAVPIECPKGTLVLLHSGLVHYSEQNKSEVARHAYSIHVVDGAEDVLYPADNWLQRPKNMPFRFLC